MQPLAKISLGLFKDRAFENRETGVAIVAVEKLRSVFFGNDLVYAAATGTLRFLAVVPNLNKVLNHSFLRGVFFE